MTDQLPDGVYFDLPEADYHAQHRLSASAVCRLLVSPATFWASSWMNPNRQEDEDSPARIIGRAYHCARLEPDRFRATYRPMPAQEDYGPGLLRTDTDVKAALKLHGLPAAKAGELARARAHRLLEADPDALIWSVILDDWRLEHGEHVVGLSVGTFAEIEADQKAIHGDPELAPFFTGGAAEVSVLWTDKAGTGWKARIDYLQPGRIVDLKTFENTRGKHLDQCIADAIRYNRYYIQAALYWQVGELLRQGKLPLSPASMSDQQIDLLSAIEERNRPFDYWWVFQEKNGVPNVLARQFRVLAPLSDAEAYQAPDAASAETLRQRVGRKTGIYAKACAEIDHAAGLFRQCMEIWGETEPWRAMRPIGDIGDEDFNPYWLSGERE